MCTRIVTHANSRVYTRWMLAYILKITALLSINISYAKSNRINPKIVYALIYADTHTHTHTLSHSTSLFLTFSLYFFLSLFHTPQLIPLWPISLLIHCFMAGIKQFKSFHPQNAHAKCTRILFEKQTWKRSLYFIHTIYCTSYIDVMWVYGIFV